MKYPSYETIQIIENLDKKEDFIFDLIKSCIDYIFDENNVYSSKETDPKELDDFIDSLNVKQLNLIKDYFYNLPKINKEIQITCDRCGYEHKISARGIEDFLG